MAGVGPVQDRLGSPNRKATVKVYIAGPMRGIPLYNFPAFHAAAERLRALGHDVFSPAERDIQQDGFDPATDEAKSLEYYLEHDLPEVCRCDAIAMLKGWKQSVGAQVELYVARAIGKKVLDADTGRELKPTVLDEAEELVSGDRDRDYGHPSVDLHCIAKMWDAYFAKRSVSSETAGFTARDVSMMMILVKVSREANRPKRDNLVDIAGYARCAERLWE
jgi:hypothetical protein